MLVTLTTDEGKLLSNLHGLQPKGSVDLLRGLSTAWVRTIDMHSVCIVSLPSQLALKHRQNKNNRQRIVAFVGSPIDHDEKEV